MAEMINKWEVVDKLTDLENKLQQYKPFTKHEQEMYHKICQLEIEIGKTSGVELIRCKNCKHWSGEILGKRCKYHSGLYHAEEKNPDQTIYVV